MKTLGSIVVAGVFALVAGRSLAQHEGHDMGAGKNPQTHAKPIKKSHPMKGQTVTVNNGKYSPSTINVKAGKPVHLTFKLGANPGCGDTLVIKGYGINKKLAKGKGTMVMFTPKKSGRIAFTCGMGMYKGTIVAK